MDSHGPRKKRKTNTAKFDETDKRKMKYGTEKTDDERTRNGNLNRILDLACNIANNEENISPLASLANLALEKEATKHLMTLGIAERMGQYITHKNLKIQEMVAGTFRNLSATGGMDICLSLVEEGLCSYICIAVKEDIELANAFLQGNDEENLSLVLNCLKQLISLLWNLCESSGMAIKLFNEEKMMLSLMNLFMLPRRDLDLVLPVAQCFGTVTEKNDDATVHLVNNQACLDAMLLLLCDFKQSYKQLFIASTISGVLTNMNKKLDENRWMQIADQILKIIAHALDLCFLDSLKNIASKNSEIENCLYLLYAKQTCLELLANMFCLDDDVDMMEISDDDDGSDLYIGKEDDDDNETSKFLSCLKNFMSTTSVSEKVLYCIKHREIPEVVVLKENPETNNLYRALERVEKSALVCLGNMIDGNILSDYAMLEILWKNVTDILCCDYDTFEATDPELLGNFTGCLRAVAVAISERNCHQFLSNENNVVKMVERWYFSTKDEHVKCNLLKVLGAVGKFYAKREDGKSHLQQIAAVLARELTIENHVIIITEALDASFDAFGEDGFSDEVLSSSGLAKQLCQLATRLKAKLKAEKKLTNEQKDIAQTTRINLDRFIVYKKFVS